MNTDKKAKELMTKYPDKITMGELLKEVPNDEDRREVFGKMVYFAQCEENDKLFGA